MSIYASLAAPDDSEHTDDCAQWEKHDDFWEISDRPCDCGQPDSPLVYQGSHILPDEKHDKRGGFVDIAEIPPHITRDGRDDRSEDEGPWPYLRLGVNEGTVVLTRRNVQEITTSLIDWLNRTSALASTETLESLPVTEKEGFEPSFDAKSHGNWVGIHREGFEHEIGAES